MTDLHKIWHNDAERVSQVIIQDGGRSIRLRNPFCIIMRYCNLSVFKMAAGT